MKTMSALHCPLLAGIAMLAISSCTSTRRTAAHEPQANPAAPAKGKTAQSAAAGEEVDEYAVTEVADPLEPLNRATFWLNDGMYTVFLRPLSKTYEMLFPKPVRKGIDNVFDNVKFPVRFVNCALQGKFKRAGQETGKFVVNTVGGIGGILRPSDRIGSLADVPAEDTGQTLATWGIGHGAYIVLPFLGPSSVRETVGFAGDYVLNPVDWGIFWHGGHDWEHDWTMALPSSNTLRSLPSQLDTYDTATKDAVDSYLSARSAYIQNRAEAARQ